MRRRCEAERLRLFVLGGMQTRGDFAVPDNDHGQHEAEDRRAQRNHAREADGLEHDIAETGDLVRLDDFHHNRRAWRLHRSSVQPRPCQYVVSGFSRTGTRELA